MLRIFFFLFLSTTYYGNKLLIILIFYRYCKEEHITPGSPRMYEFTHLIAEAKSRYSANLKPYASTHDILDTIEAFHQINFNYFSIPPVSIKTKPVLFILRRRENYGDFIRNITAAVSYINEEENSEEMNDVSEASNSEVKVLKTDTLKQEIVAEKKILSRELVMPETIERNTPEKEDSLKTEIKVKSKEVSKSSEGENSSDKRQKKSIKQSIRKLISKYRRIKTDKVDDKPPLVETTKLSVKQLIQQEKANVEKEELKKIQLQVLSLIESNPNIINKDIIKEKIETTVMQELTAAIDPDTQKQIKPVKTTKVYKKQASLEITTPDSDKIQTLEFPLKPKKQKDLFLPKLTRKPVADNKLEELIETATIDENAVGVYEHKNIKKEMIVEETSFEGDTEREVDLETDVEEKLQLASEQIENLMTIISEIVDTIEVADENSR